MQINDPRYGSTPQLCDPAIAMKKTLFAAVLSLVSVLNYSNAQQAPGK
jgi:hypothetical protein